MSSFTVIFIVALIIALVVTPLARGLALRLKVVDNPGPRRIHIRPVPLLGGIAIYLAFVIALIVFTDHFNLPQLVAILVGATFVSFLGVWDDAHGLRPIVKLLGQIFASGIVILAGVHTSLFPIPALDYVVTILWMVAITNALNLLDNMDGLSGGIAAAAAAFFLLLAAMSGQYLVASLAAGLLGACLGFLRYNFNPASIFMGDTGSMFLGFVLAALAIKLRFGNITLITWMIPVLVLGIPIFDTALVTISRLRRRLNPLTTPGKDHMSHRLVALGMSNREAVLTLYVAGGALGMSTLFLTQAGLIEAYIMGGVVIAFSIWAFLKLEAVNYEGRKPKEVGALGAVGTSGSLLPPVFDPALQGKEKRL